MDDLLDLNWSAPSKPASAKSTPTGGATPASGAASFDFLTQSRPVSRTGTPNYYSSTPLRAATPSQPTSAALQVNNARLAPASSVASGRNTPVQPPPVQASGGGGGGGGGLDAFSSLLSMPSSSGANGGTMTMAQRQKVKEDEKKRQDEEDRKRFEAEGDFWDNLGSSSSTSTTAVGPIQSQIKVSQHPPGLTTTNGHDYLDDFLKPTPAGSARTKTPLQPASNEIVVPIASAAPSGSKSSAGTFWDDFGDSTASTIKNQFPPIISAEQKLQKPGSFSSQSRSPAPPADPFDFDALEGAVPKPNGGDDSTIKTPLSNFDFGDGGDNDEDDILGDLGKPVTAKPNRRPSQAESGSSRPTKSSATRPSSPPPHIVGQIVEMGFSPAQARQALAKTDLGLDVQAALELLLGGQASSSGARARRQDDFPEDDDDLVERERQRREEEEKERRRRRRAGPSRDSVRARTYEEREQDREATTSDQAEKYLAQASEIGANMFSKATSFWNSSKEKAMKVYEEQRKAMEANAAAAAARDGGDGARKPVRDGRPRWMTEAAEDGFPKEKNAGAGGFRDDHEGLEPAWSQRDFKQRARTGEDIDQNGAGPSYRSRATTSPAKPRRPAEQASDYRSPKERADLLFVDDAPRTYISPARHPKKQATTSRPVTPAAPLPARQLVSATPQQLSSSAAHKAKGNEHFKLGRFAEAESSYSSAISSLPEGHLFLVPLHNNRAAARLKLGDSGPAASDCTVVIDLIGPSYHPSKEAPLPADVASEVKLANGLIKAMTKRAQAWEMGEKWKNAVEDWERVMGFDLSMLGTNAGPTKNLAAEGARRSRKMLEGNSVKPQAAPARKPASAPTFARPSPRPPATAANADKSAAVSELRKAAQAQEAEDNQRSVLKDSVDAKINAWKAGKETNIRGLIASLDTVLWDDILKGGLKVGLHELVTDKQVKIKYMKVIARLHPDKMNVQSTTVEQRMLANDVFGILNEAWRAFIK
ncbi:hypothetical protein I317_03088 [Kwoniella heveanensis CBS 569]|nr:hypothetical protein I317_03088 [Kwoniella heveanensis CBS 569]